MPRTICIGDIHGCADALEGLLREVRPRRDDTIVVLGDYIDRGPDSKEVIEQLIALSDRCHVVALRGNHEQMMLDAHTDWSSMAVWQWNGGGATLDSYGARSWEDIPSDHFDFIRSTRLYYETNDHIFVHANYDEKRSLDKQDPDVLLWRHLDEVMPGPHISGKVVFVGHTPMMDEVFDLGHLVCLDTGCGKGGSLSALDVDSRELWQVDATGCVKDQN